jgi:hypothetical protein
MDECRSFCESIESREHLALAPPTQRLAKYEFCASADELAQTGTPKGSPSSIAVDTILPHWADTVAGTASSGPGNALSDILGGTNSTLGGTNDSAVGATQRRRPRLLSIDEGDLMAAQAAGGTDSESGRSSAGSVSIDVGAVVERGAAATLAPHDDDDDDDDDDDVMIPEQPPRRSRLVSIDNGQAMLDTWS